MSMVSTKFDSRSYKPWKPVARPVSKSDLAFPGTINGPPAVPPKPGGKVFVYVYEAPGMPGAHQPISQAGSGTLPPNAQLVIGGPPTGAPPPTNGPAVPYPHSNEYSGQDARTRLKQRAKKAGKGYKVLADVNPGSLRSSSKGGKMFMKQKKRMDEYTSLASSGKAGVDSQYYPPRSSSALEEEGPTPWNMTSSAGVKYEPAALYNTPSKEKKRRGPVIRPLDSPPPEWRAKVDSDYSLYDDVQTLPTRRWNSVDATHRSHSSRSESAPPPANMYYPYNGAQDEEDGRYDDSTYDFRPDSKNGIALVNFNARMHKGAPHRKQGVREGRGIFTTRPHVQLDFNARPVGWSRAYARQY